MEDSLKDTRDHCGFAAIPEMDVQVVALIQRRDLGPDAVALAHFRCFDLVLVLANRCLLTFDFDFAGQLGRWGVAH